MEKEIYLSIVIAVRNDNYGGDFNKRLHNALKWNTDLLEKHRILSEIILVNWNPIKDNPPLLTGFDLSQTRNFVQYNIIEVPEELHERFHNEELRKKLPMYEFIAKNVGMKRAKGKFILCTNADILFSEQVIQEIAKGDLKQNTLYRSIRADYQSTHTPNFTEKEIKNSVSAFFLRTGTFSSLPGLNFHNSLKWSKFKDAFLQIVYSIWLNIIARLNYYEERIFIFKYPFNASGDFALIDQPSFIEKARYPEDTRISTHVDSMHLVKCLEQGLKIAELEGIVYHQEHPRRFDFNKKDNDMDLMFERLLQTIHDYLKGSSKQTKIVNMLDEIELNKKSL